MKQKSTTFTSLHSLAVIILLLVATKSFSAPTNEYLLKWTPRKLATCQDDATSIAGKFARVGARVQSASCIRDLGHSAEISLFLDPDTIPPIYSAVFAYHVGSPIDSIYRRTPLNHRYDLYYAAGYFKNFNDCLAGAPALELMYHQQTGLEPIASQCIAVDRGARYALQIDGLGVPRTTLNRFEQRYFKRHIDQSTLDLIMQRLKVDGFQIFDSRWDEEHLFIMGWGEVNLKLETPYLYESNYFSTPGECESQKNIVGRILSNLGRSILLVQCDTKSPRPRLTVLAEVNANSEENFIDVEQVGRFGSMEECVANLSSTPNILDRFCSLNVDYSGRNQGYRMNRIFARQRF